MTKVAYIIASYIDSRNSHIHDPAIPRTEWRSIERHDQDYSTEEKVHNMIHTHVRNVQTMDFGPNIELDVYLVLNSKLPHMGSSLDELDGLKTLNGTVHVIKRNNVGHSYGAYTDTYESLRDEYDAFYFTEDDFLLKEREFFAITTQALKQDPSIGFFTSYCFNEQHPQTHVNGAIGIALTTSLKKIEEKFGRLMPEESYVDNRKLAIHAEVAFTNRYPLIGLKLGQYKSPDGSFAIVPYYKFMKTRKNCFLFRKGISYTDVGSHTTIEFGGNEIGRIEGSITTIYFKYRNLGLEPTIEQFIGEGSSND
jgi:hypothetical protein